MNKRDDHRVLCERSLEDIKSIQDGMLGEIDELRANFRDLRAAVEQVLKSCPQKEPEHYTGDNHGDSYDCGWSTAKYRVGQTLRDALREAGIAPAAPEPSP